MIDGWYIDAPGMPKWKGGAGHMAAVLTNSAGGQKPAIPRIEVKQNGPAPDGLAVWQKVTSSVTLPRDAGHEFESVSEVIELVEGTLPDKLFHEPDGYLRVESLPGLR